MEAGASCDGKAACDDEARRAHEARCLRCGRCCYAKLLVEGRVIYTDIPCGYLDVETNLCTVYERRHEMNPDCLGVEAGIRRGVFPADCPYVRGVRGYRPPVVRPEPGGLGELFEALEAEEVET